MIALWFIFGIVGAMIGSRKGETIAGFLVGILLGPLGVFIICFSSGNRVACPFCKKKGHKMQQFAVIATAN